MANLNKLIWLQDEVVKLSPHARAIRDVEDEEIRSFFYGMSPWQVCFKFYIGRIPLFIYIWKKKPTIFSIICYSSYSWLLLVQWGRSFSTELLFRLGLEKCYSIFLYEMSRLFLCGLQDIIFQNHRLVRNVKLTFLFIEAWALYWNYSTKV